MTQKQTPEGPHRRLQERVIQARVGILFIVCVATVLSPKALAAQPLPPDVLVEIGDLPPGKTITIEFDVTVRTPFPALVNEVSNQGIITGANIAAFPTDDPDTPLPADPTVTEISAAPDLVISKDDEGKTYLRGDTVLYTLSYANIGDQNVTDVNIIDTLPANTTFNSASSTAGWACASGLPGQATCTLTVGEVPGGSGGSVAYAVTIDALTPNGTQLIVNTGEIAAGVGQPDANPANNSTSDLTFITGKSPDIDGNTAVTEADLFILMRDYHTDSDRSDMNGDGWIDWIDVWIFGRHWGVRPDG
jgi:uncharacterized repeat protein (TIGR01451 family)